jgi:hypothetical protein
MAKNRGTSRHVTLNDGRKSVALRHDTVESEEDFLPSPEIISELIKHDPNFLEWYKNKIDLEQSNRHLNDSAKRTYNGTVIDESFKHDKRVHYLVFLLVIVPLLTSGLMAYLHLPNIITGSSVAIAFISLIGILVKKRPSILKNSNNNAGDESNKPT